MLTNFLTQNLCGGHGAAQRPEMCEGKRWNFRKQLAEWCAMERKTGGDLELDMNLGAIFGPRPEQFKLHYYSDVENEDLSRRVQSELAKLESKYQFKLYETDAKRLADHWCNIHKEEDVILESLGLPTDIKLYDFVCPTATEDVTNDS